MGIGLVPDAGGTTFVPPRVGVRRAGEFFMRNQTWDAATAHAAGLVGHVVDDDKRADEAWAVATGDEALAALDRARPLVRSAPR